MKKLTKFLCTILVVTVFFGAGLFADTIILKNGKRVKGLILDEYKDRIVVSTADGEKIIMKSRIRSAIYDNEARALIQKARNQVKQRKYVKAYYTYAEALELDSSLDEAREQLTFLRGYLENKMKNDVVNKLKDKKEKFEGVERKTSLQRVADELGLVLAANGKYTCIEEVANNGSGAVKPGDRIISVWGERTAYMRMEEVADILLRPEECKLVVERAVVPRFASNGSHLNSVIANGYEKIIGAKLKLKKRGVVTESIIPGGPFDLSGIKKGDLLYRIKDKNTRYMPMSKIIDIIRENQNKDVEILIRRNVTLWRKKEQL